MNKNKIMLWIMTLLSSALIFYGITLLKQAKKNENSANERVQRPSK